MWAANAYVGASLIFTIFGYSRFLSKNLHSVLRNTPTLFFTVLHSAPKL